MKYSIRSVEESQMRKNEIADEILEYFDLIEKQLDCCRTLLKLLLAGEVMEVGKETMDKGSNQKTRSTNKKG